MKTENWQSGAILLLLRVIYDIIEIIKNFLKHKRKNLANMKRIRFEQKMYEKDK